MADINYTNDLIERSKKTIESTFNDVKKQIGDANGGIKHDNSKPRMELLSTQWLLGVSQVLTFGAKKYGSHNWRKGLAYSRLIGAALRHITAYNDGQDLDPETQLSHLHHASCCLMFLAELSETRKDLDDRYKSGKTAYEKALDTHSSIANKICIPFLPDLAWLKSISVADRVTLKRLSDSGYDNKTLWEVVLKYRNKYGVFPWDGILGE